MVCQGKGSICKISLWSSRCNKFGKLIESNTQFSRSRKKGEKKFFLLLLQNQKKIYNSCRIMHKQKNMIMLIYTFICGNFYSKEHPLKYIFETLEKWLVAVEMHILLFTSLRKCFCKDIFSTKWEMPWLLWLSLHELSSCLDEDALPHRITSET